MKQKFSSILWLTTIALALAFSPWTAFASDITYATLTPQNSDSELVIGHKAALATTRLYTALTTGTNALVLSGTTFTVVGTQNVALTGTGSVTIATTAPVETRFSVTNITTSGTTTVSGAAGVLRSITLNKAGTASQAIVKDGSTVLATIDTSTGAPVTLMYDAVIATGISVITSGSTAANVTVSYR